MRQGFYGKIRLEAGSLAEHAFMHHEIRERGRGLLTDLLTVGDRLTNLDDIVARLYHMTFGTSPKAKISDSERTAFIQALQGTNWGDYLFVEEGADDNAAELALKATDPFLRNYL